MRLPVMLRVACNRLKIRPKQFVRVNSNMPIYSLQEPPYTVYRVWNKTKRFSITNLDMEFIRLDLENKK